MAGLNKVQLIGHCGRDTEVRYLRGDAFEPVGFCQATHPSAHARRSDLQTERSA